MASAGRRIYVGQSDHYYRAIVSVSSPRIPSRDSSSSSSSTLLSSQAESHLMPVELMSRSTLVGTVL
ncbi:hypothetical protein PGTUg99_009616 [Puccinia graminis f. sp. tritici]|uniref:Uncharacterized protein n=1 Tax=Puccinia graminis f. sp. tritici TaxID=56615 RepID=A0A5B0QGQ3_PUCGR|nr:hypothetical protein PGTUg99_009616 [Puccinia graminis f. sp. tritici]